MSDNTKCSQEFGRSANCCHFFEEQFSKFIRILNRHVFESAFLLTEIYPTNILVKVYQYISPRIFI